MKVLSTGTTMVLVAMAAFAQQRPQGKKLSNTELKEAFVSGISTEGDWPQLGTSDARIYLRGGIVHAVYSDPDGNGNSTQGEWRIEQDSLCVTFPMTHGIGGCASIYKLADGSYETWVESKEIYPFRLKPPPTAVALSPTAVGPAGTQLKGADLAQTFTSGTIIIGDSQAQGLSFVRQFLRAGILHTLYADTDGNGGNVQGRWRIDHDALCIVSSQIGGGAGGPATGEVCTTVYTVSDGSYETWSNGKRTTTFHVKRLPVARALNPAG